VDIISDSLDGYVVDEYGRIIGEARGYDPYSRFGEVMFYEIDVFGFIAGYIHDNWNVLSRTDIVNDKILLKQLEKTEYENWKRHNIAELMIKYDRKPQNESFTDFCKFEYHRILNDKHTG